ncbi:hypothetical protein G6F46_015370 [Rhizopus delemar]|nr:hypothetical protein G6F46_015370 [Rhizopus delemar]
MAQILQHLQAAGADVDLGRRATHHRHQAARLLQRAGAGGKARHRDGQDVRTRQAQRIHGLGADQQRVGGVQPAGNADDDLGHLAGGQALHQGLHLDVVDLFAPGVAALRVGRHIGKARHAPLKR